MRIFQNSGLYPSYCQRLDRLARDSTLFSQRLDIFLNDRYGAPHILKPILESCSQSFFTNGDDEILQQRWAREHGMPRKCSLTDILLAQIEHHQTEIFYNMDPVRFNSSFIQKLPDCVKTSIAWRAAPSPNVDFSAYDLMVCNFPGIIEQYRKKGLNAEYFSPAHDPEMDSYWKNNERPIDVLFIGGYSRHHMSRALILESVAAQSDNLNIVMHLDCSRLTNLLEKPVIRLLPFSQKYCRPRSVADVSYPPLFGRDMYKAISLAKIVLNGAIDMSAQDRGNMRCFEAMGCGGMMISDVGNYPSGMMDRHTMRTYQNTDEIVPIIQQAIKNQEYKEIAQNAGHMIRDLYNKENQWDDFVKLVEKCS